MSTTDLAALARDAGLSEVGRRPSLGAYLVEAWRRRAFAIALARYRIQVAMGKNYLGFGWLVLRPILLAIMYATVFGFILSRAAEPSEFIPFVMSGVFTIRFFTASMNGGARLISGNKSLVNSLHFPRILLPVAEVLEQFFLWIPTMAMMLLIFTILGKTPQWEWALIIVPMLLMTVFISGVITLVGRLAFHIPDITQVVPLVNRFFFYMSGVFFSIEGALADKPDLLFWAKLNPVHAYLQLIRSFVLEDQVATSLDWIVASGAAVTLFLLGFFLFWRGEEKYSND